MTSSNFSVFWRQTIWLIASLMPALILAVPASSQENTATIIAPDTSSYVLENGLQIVVLPDHRAPVVTHMVWYKVGSADEERGKSGIAHFLEHLMFKGTPSYPDGEFSKIVASLGGQENAFTSTDYTGYFQRVAKEHLPLMMEMESDRMSNLILAPEQVAPELKVVLEERAQRVDSSPGGQLGEEVTATLFPNHPYGTPIIGWEHEIAALTQQDAFDFYNKYYTPNNVVLIVAGDVTGEEVLELARNTYGKVKRRFDVPARRRATDPVIKTAKTVTLIDARVQQPSFQRAYIVPSYSTAKSGEAESLDILINILGRGASSRLYKSAVKSGVANGSGGYYQGSSLDHSRIVFWGTPRGDNKVADVEAILDQEILRIVKDGVTGEEVSRARRKMIASSLYSQDSQESMARTFGVALTSGQTIRDVQHWPEDLGKVTAQMVQDAAIKWLVKTRSVSGYLQPASKSKSAEKEG
ncbi:MAG: insulinase family protein [Cohaesibacteraceae bacterium]|nr:insulinase family protein [Cohaesibacteraceae bacterium]MBL4875617.1 insulinase family protein [Cohaesibacteraceae bacterium]